MGSALFPPSYAPWLTDRLKGSRAESLATCDNCAMVKPTGLTRDKGPFLNHLKCCTYFPFLPNFSLGALPQEKLQLAQPRGLLLPVGLFPSAEEQNLIDELGIDGFGRRSELLCPFFETKKNHCSIWEQRPGVCNSYFCKSDEGKKGLKFWKDIESYLNHFEWKLACEVFYQMGFTENELAYCQGAMSAETEDDERLHFEHAAWGKWFDKKYEFYQKSRELALLISPEKVGQLLEPEFLALEAKLSV